MRGSEPGRMFLEPLYWVLVALILSITFLVISLGHWPSAMAFAFSTLPFLIAIGMKRVH